MKNELGKLNETIADAIHEFQTKNEIQVKDIKFFSGVTVSERKYIRVNCIVGVFHKPVEIAGQEKLINKALNENTLV